MISSLFKSPSRRLAKMASLALRRKERSVPFEPFVGNQQTFGQLLGNGGGAPQLLRRPVTFCKTALMMPT